MNLTTKEAADLLRVSRKHIYRLIDSGKIPAYKPSGRILINRSALMAYIEDSQVQPKSKPVNITVRRRPTRTSGVVYRGERNWVGGAS